MKREEMNRLMEEQFGGRHEPWEPSEETLKSFGRLPKKARQTARVSHRRKGIFAAAAGRAATRAGIKRFCRAVIQPPSPAFLPTKRYA
jgi:hypothetical protein